MVLPGDLISKIPTVTNKGEPCWLRAKIAYGNTSDTLDGFSDDNISGITEDWVKIGEYYYYKNILDKGETVDIFTGVTIPSTWTEEHADQSLAVGIVAEAIQAANYKPDFESMSPWGNEEIQLAVAESDGEETERLENVKLSVQFNGDAHKLVAAPSDFFQNFSVAMPGDVFTDSVELSNTTDRDAELFFNTEQLGLSGEQDETAQKFDAYHFYGRTGTLFRRPESGRYGRRCQPGNLCSRTDWHTGFHGFCTEKPGQ